MERGNSEGEREAGGECKTEIEERKVKKKKKYHTHKKSHVR